MDSGLSDPISVNDPEEDTTPKTGHQFDITPEE
jgi:hypothetical protein